MFDWLFEGRLTVFLALGVAGLVLLALWTRNRHRGLLFGIGAIAVLLVAYFLLDRSVETGREQITRKLHELAAGVKARSADRIFEHVAERFSFGGLDKPGFRRYVEDVLRRGVVNDLTIWNVSVPDGSGKANFLAKPKGTRPGMESSAGYRVRATFVREADGQWRLESFEVFGPLTNDPLPIPGLPH